MKKIMCVILATAALAACTKSETQYEPAAEIGFAPATENITKAAMPAGNLGPTEKLGVWAMWNYDEATGTVDGTTGTINDTNNPYTNYDVTYLSNASFANRTTSNNWGGENTSYPWPTNGALVFAGYTKPTNTQTDFNVTYTLNDNSETTNIDEADVMTFTNFTQSTMTDNTYDLCWFGRTASSYNNRANGTAVPVTLSHALTWITIQIKGKENSLPVTAKWQVTEVTLNDIKNVGTGTCKGTTTSTIVDGTTTVTPATATWTFAENATTNSMTIYTSTTDTDTDTGTNTGQEITATAAAIETTANGTIIIPQKPTTLTVKWKYSVGNETKEEQTTINLSLTGHKDENGNTITNTIDTWKAGTHYTYTLVFNSNEILVAPTYSGWSEVNQTVTVE